MEEKLPDVLGAPASSPSPFMSTEMDAARYYSFLGEAIAMDTGEGEDKASPEARAAMQEVMGALAQVLKRIRVDINFTERGIEMPSTAELADSAD